MSRWLPYLGSILWRAGLICLPIYIYSYVLPEPFAEKTAAIQAEIFEVPIGSKSLSLEDAFNLKNNAWRHADPSRALGFPSETREVWYRIKLPKMSAPEPMVLRVGSGFETLDEVDFYLINGNQLGNHSAQGSDRWKLGSPVRTSYRYLPLTDRDLSCYVKIRASWMLSSPIRLLTEDEFARYNTVWLLLEAIPLGIVVCFFFIAIIQTVADESRTLEILYLFNLFSLLVFVMNNMALTSYIFPTFPRSIFVKRLIFQSSLILCFLSCALLLQQYLTANLSFVKALKRILASVTISLILSLCLIRINMTVFLLVTSLPFLVLATTLSQKVRSEPMGFSIKEIHVLLLAILCANAIFLITTNGIFPVTMFTETAQIWMPVYFIASISTDLMRRMQAIQHSKREAIRALDLRSKVIDASSNEQNVLDELEVSIMFIDIVSFANLTENRDSSDVFRILSRETLQIKDIIYRFQGAIDRSLGDGLVCYFAPKPEEQQHEHCRRAFEAARSIQDKLLAQALLMESRKSSEFQTALRIGLHLGKVVIGNMGDQKRVDYTMVGEGVNFANRLEGGCRPYCIMSSQVFAETLQCLGWTKGDFYPVHIGLKHQRSLIKAYEHNPFAHEPENFSLVMKRFQQQLGIHSRQSRYHAEPGKSLHLRSPYAAFQLRDFSLDGFKLYSKDCIAQNAIFELELSIDDEKTFSTLQANFLERLTVEVRWIRSVADGYEHGIKILGHSLKQREILMDLLLAHMASESQDKDVA